VYKQLQNLKIWCLYSQLAFFSPKTNGLTAVYGAGLMVSPDVNIFENRNEYIITIATNGLNKKDINIDNLENTIAVCLSRHKKNKLQKFYGEDFSCSSFSLSFTKPAALSQNKMTVSYENGALCICLHK